VSVSPAVVHDFVFSCVVRLLHWRTQDQSWGHMASAEREPITVDWGRGSGAERVNVCTTVLICTSITHTNSCTAAMFCHVIGALLIHIWYMIWC